MRPKRLLIIMLCLFVLNLNAQTISYNWLERIGLAKEILRTVKLEHSSKTVTYTQKVRIPSYIHLTKSARESIQGTKGKSKSKRKSRVIIRKHTDYAWKEVALVVMDADNGNLEIVKIKKAGQELLNSNSKYDVSIEKRPSGLTWNGKNTAFSITAKSSIYVVVANKWLERLANGKLKEHIYSPYSAKLRQKELIEAGDKHLDDDIYWAMGQLAGWGVGSLTFPDKKVADIVPRNYLKNIILTEQTDPQEFYAFLAGTAGYDPFERVKVIIGANGEDAYATTTSDADALGWTQFTEPTWNLMIKECPHAKLPDFKSGAPDHISSLQATALLYNYNLNKLVEAFGRIVLGNPGLELYLAAAHNCGINRVITALKKPGKDWRQALRRLSKTDETIIFLGKVDYLLREKK